MYIFIVDLRFYQQKLESGATLDEKAAFASLFDLSYPKMPVCEGVHAMII